MIAASTAWDLQTLFGGRFVLGLGSQIRAHNLKRFSVPWSVPARKPRSCRRSNRALPSRVHARRIRDFRGRLHRNGGDRRSRRPCDRGRASPDRVLRVDACLLAGARGSRSRSLGHKLNAMSQAGQCDEMADEVDDDVLSLFCARGIHGEIAGSYRRSLWWAPQRCRHGCVDAR